MMASSLRLALLRLPTTFATHEVHNSNTAMLMVLARQQRWHARSIFTGRIQLYAAAPPTSTDIGKTKDTGTPPPPELARSSPIRTSTSPCPVKKSPIVPSGGQLKTATPCGNRPTTAVDSDELKPGHAKTNFDGEPIVPASALPYQQQHKKKTSREAVRDNVKGYVFTRYFDYVKNYDKVLEKNFPSAVKVYRVFFDGVKDFYSDMRRYLKVSRIAHTSENGLAALNRRELELFMQMPRDMVKVAPALIFSSLPFVGYAIFPLVFMYPRKLLCSHFWTIQQRSEFQQIQLRDRLNNNRGVLRCLQAKLKTVRKHERHGNLSEILGLIGSGFHPTVDAILQMKDIFVTAPYSLNALSGKHVKLLCHLHGLSSGFFKRHRLAEHAFVVHHMDLAIMREGGVHNMPTDAIRYSCYIRGLNPSNLSTEEMIEWLRNWIQISTNITQDHISLFLHLPVLMAYNHPNNWQLIYGDKKK